jgi:RNA polymerase sigma factor for flagellar operon FliA
VRLTSRTVDLQARDALVMRHVPLVRSLAQRLSQRLPAQVELNDLISVGVLGLVQAANRYRPTLGVPFDAFARRRVNGAMLDSLRELDWAPRSLRRLRRNLDTTLARLRHELRREPNEREIAAAMNLSVPDYERAVESLRALDAATIRQLDATGPDGEWLLGIAIDPDEGFVAKLERKELGQHLAQAITSLPERERQILALFYEEEWTLAEIGEVLGLSESRVCQLRMLAISCLRAALGRSLGIELRR